MSDKKKSPGQNSIHKQLDSIDKIFEKKPQKIDPKSLPQKTEPKSHPQPKHKISKPKAPAKKSGKTPSSLAKKRVNSEGMRIYTEEELNLHI